MENSKTNSQQYWNERFLSGDWDKNMGQEQTYYFYSLLMKMLPDWFKIIVRQTQYSIIDFGCAEGQGIPLLAAGLNPNIKGIDFSEYAINRARENFPQYNFEVGDIWRYSQAVDVSIMSNIIEHFPNPYELLSKMASITQKYMVVMVPLEEENLMSEHCFTFMYQNIPTSIGEFQLVHFVEHDCRNDIEQLFLAKQVLLVYSKDTALNQHLTIEQMDGLLSLREHQAEELRIFLKLDEIDKKETSVSQAVDNLKEVPDNLRQLNESNERLFQKETEIYSAIKQLEQNIANWKRKSAKQVILREREIKETIQSAFQQYSHNKELERKNRELSILYNEVDQKYVELVNRFNQLNDIYGLVVAENVGIKTSRTYRIAVKEKILLDKLHLTEMLKFMLSIRRNGIKESVRQRKAQKAITEIRAEESLIFQPDNSEKTPLSDTLLYMQAHRKICEDYLLNGWNEITWNIVKIMHQCTYKGIIVYPHAVHWEPIQRPQQFLRIFAKEGYLCFFCESNTNGEGVRKVDKNLFIVHGEENLLPALQNRCPVVMVTYHQQAVFCDLLPQKLLWFDILDNLDFFAGATENTVPEIYTQLIANADIVTYSADNLRQYAKDRKDAFKLNNGVYLDDFHIDSTGYKSIEMLKQIKEKGAKIIGYYGAIEEWFDIGAIEQILAKTKYEIILIGKVGLNIEKIQNERLHYLGAIPYQELKHYAHYFDVAMIPFIVNKLTDSVSPVKFFEYVAQGLPVISSNIHEMQQYEGTFVHIYHDYNELINSLDFLCSHKTDVRLLNTIAQNNTWKMRVDKAIYELSKNIDNLRFVADISSYGCIAVEAVTFFKYDGTTYYSGGAERYLLDLDEVCQELGIQYRIYQYGEYDWVRFYNNVEVIGLGAKKNDVNRYDCPLVQEMENLFSCETTSSIALNIYSPFYILTRKGACPSVGISHGISWDSEYNHFTEGNTFWQVNKNIIDAASYCDYMISVDTNTCNWFQTLDYDTGRKIKYIPNYVDNEEFCPEEDAFTPKERIIITYPRRLYGARGLYVVLEIIDDVLEKYPHTEFHFVGKGFEVDTKHVEKKIKKWGSRVKWYSKTPDTMYEVYRYTDIALIPTMYSEGTSLSCLEALSSGNAVIATRVGGLTDLILSGYNGILAEPNGESIKQAVFDLLEHPEKMKAIKENAVKTAKTFSKSQWKQRWKEAILSAIGNRATVPYQRAIRCLVQLSSVEDLNSETVISSIWNCLEDGKYVYIACKNNPLKVKSYKRLQFINDNEELYFEPEEVININNLTKGNR